MTKMIKFNGKFKGSVLFLKKCKDGLYEAKAIDGNLKPFIITHIPLQCILQKNLKHGVISYSLVHNDQSPKDKTIMTYEDYIKKEKSHAL